MPKQTGVLYQSTEVLLRMTGRLSLNPESTGTRAGTALARSPRLYCVHYMQYWQQTAWGAP